MCRLLALPTKADVQVQSLEKRGARTAAPKGCLSVGSGATYNTIASAIKALGSSKNDACLYIKSGTYKEQLTIDYAGALTFYGETADTSSYKSNKVLITHGISSPAAGSLDASSTMNIRAANFKMYNINVENSFGKGAQAVAVTANANKLSFYGCSFLGYQDTLYVKTGTQYYSNCLMKGAVDYIFGDASAWFDSCTIMSNGPGAITASSRTTSDDTAWYVFNNVNVISDGTDLVGKVFLGRPWRVNARVMFQKSQLSNVVNAAGWTEMADGATPRYYEYKNSGDGSNTSKRKWTINASAAISINTVLGDSYSSWVDQSGTGSSSSSTSTTVSKTAAAKQVTPAKSAVANGPVCTPTAGGAATKDDTPAIYAAIQKCGNGGTIVIPAGKTYYLNTGNALNIAYSNLNMSAVSTSKNLPKNTDGFDIGASTYVTLTDITVLNDDDCVAFKPGSNFTTVIGITCTGSHGLSVGSLGKSNADSVSNIYVSDATMISSSKAVGIKTYPMGNGHGISTVTNVTYTNIKVQNSDYAIQIQSCYGEDGTYCETNGNNAVLKGIVFENFFGTTSKKYSPTTANLNCGAKGTCDVKVKNYAVKAGSGTGQPRNYFNDMSFADVVVKFGKHEVHAHRVILARCSAQFEKEMIIDPETDMAVINLKATYDAKAIYVMLKHCYGIAWKTPSTPTYLYDFDFVLTVYIVANTYGISELHQKARKICCNLVSDFFLPQYCNYREMITSPFIRALMRVLGPTAVGVSDSFQEEVFEIVCHGMTHLFENKGFVRLFARGVFFNEAYAVRFAQRIRDKLLAREWNGNSTGGYDSSNDDDDDIENCSAESSSEDSSVMPSGDISTTDEVHRDYFNNETFSDIILKFGNFKIHAHKVILASNSTWFEKAFSSGFSSQEATQTTIDLGNEEDPNLLFAMLNHFYNDDYNNHIGQNNPIRDHSTLHLEIFLPADMYDAPCLRDAAKQRFIKGMTNAAKWHSPIHDEQIEVFQRVVGLDAVQFADVSLQEETFGALEMYVREIMQTPRVAMLVGRGEMFSQEFAERFARKISALLEC
ncbi:pectin lyase-like protein [Aureobasidium pullulans]|nr:pectin lyase-like protein [Aureobasidium pullulans]